jgi:hypothetical protein
MTGRKDQWVRIHDIVLKPEERTGSLPEDTKKVPLELWVKGFLDADAEIGETVSVRTITGRTMTGTLVEVSPSYDHGFGKTFIPELLDIGIRLRKILEGEDDGKR